MVRGRVVIPRTPDDFSVEWLSEALRPLLAEAGARIAGADVRYHDTPGQTADAVTIALRYDQASAALPARIFGKFTALNPEVREFSESADLYRREVSFYSEIHDAGLPVPRCYYSDFNAATYEFVLLLEDLSEGECPSWGIAAAQVVTAIEHLPAFHATWWNRAEAKGLDWAVQVEDREFWNELQGSLQTNFKQAVDRFGDQLPLEFVEIYEMVVAKYEHFRRYLGTRPFALVHGDYHMKQIFLPRTDGRGRFAVFDWQFPCVAPGPWDLARMMVLSLTTEKRRELQPGFLANYLHGLEVGGVKDYTIDGLTEDLRTGCIQNLIIHGNALGGTDVDIVEKEASDYGMRWQEVLIDRVNESLIELDALSFARSL